MPATIATAPTAKPHYSDAYKRLVLVLLVLAYTFNFIDRTIISTIGQAIKEDLKITDTQLGLLGGLYFALLYTLLGIPLARLAERYSRVNIISGAIVVWSAFTALCGSAQSFATLALFRFGVGVGEAGLSPPAHSLISDYFEPSKRASALSVYSFGIPLGAMFGAVAGGWLAQEFGWRVAFVAVGLPGVLIAIAIKLLIKEPPRGHSEPPKLVDGPGAAEPGAAAPTGAAVIEPPAAPGVPKASLAGEFREMGAVAKVLFGKWPVFNMVMGVTLFSFAGYGGGQFAQAYFLRTFDVTVAQVGLMVGLIAGASQGAGTLLGGPITDRLARHGVGWYAIVPAIGITLSYPFIVGVYTAPTMGLALMYLAVPGILSYVYLGPTFGVVQNMVPIRRRATATAILFFFLNLIALGGGPPLTGLLIDHLAAFHHVNSGAASLWTALTGAFGADAGAFQTACPGGLAPAAAGAEAMAACRGAVQVATREGLILVYGVQIWAALHYVLAAFGLKKAMAEARAERGETA